MRHINTGSIEKDKFGSENSKLFANLIRLEFHLFGSTSAATCDEYRDMRHVNIKSIDQKKKKQFGIQVNENFESIHKLQVVKWNRLTLSSVFFYFFIRNRSLDNACYREYTDAVEMLRRMWQKCRLCLGLLWCKMVLKCDLLMNLLPPVMKCFYLLKGIRFSYLYVTL